MKSLTLTILVFIVSTLIGKVFGQQEDNHDKWIKNWANLNDENINQIFHWNSSEGDQERVSIFSLSKDDWLSLFPTSGDTLTEIRIFPGSFINDSSVNAETDIPQVTFLACPVYNKRDECESRYVKFDPVVDPNYLENLKLLTEPIDSTVAAGFMQRWRNNDFRKISKRLKDSKVQKRVSFWRFHNPSYSESKGFDIIKNWTNSHKSENFVVYLALGVKNKRKYFKKPYLNADKVDKTFVWMSPIIRLLSFANGMDFKASDLKNKKEERNELMRILENGSSFEFAAPCPRTCPPDS